MKRISSLVIAIAAAAAMPAHAAPNVGVSVDIHQPGVYGRIEIGNLPPPVVVYPQPVVIAPTPVAVYQRPIYLYVPPGHQKNWARHCHRYGACGQPVYFVQESWVREHHRYDDDDDDRRNGERKHKHHRKHKHDD
jgi:hypothetical protein